VLATEVQLIAVPEIVPELTRLVHVRAPADVVGAVILFTDKLVQGLTPVIVDARRSVTDMSV